jgi:hypothetical protein
MPKTIKQSFTEYLDKHPKERIIQVKHRHTWKQHTLFPAGIYRGIVNNMWHRVGTEYIKKCSKCGKFNIERVFDKHKTN